MTPMSTEATCINACAFNPQHWLLTVGTKEVGIPCFRPCHRIK